MSLIEWIVVPQILHARSAVVSVMAKICAACSSSIKRRGIAARYINALKYVKKRFASPFLIPLNTLALDGSPLRRYSSRQKGCV